MGDEAGTLHGENKIGGSLAGPRRKILRPRQRIKRSVDLYAVEYSRSVGQLFLLGQLLRIERAAPRFIAPARNSNSYPVPNVPMANGRIRIRSHPLYPVKQQRRPELGGIVRTIAMGIVRRRYVYAARALGKVRQRNVRITSVRDPHHAPGNIVVDQV